MATNWDDLPRAALQGRLEARPTAAGGSSEVRYGEQPLGLDGGRDGVIYVPAGYRTGQPAPLMLCLHGAGGTGANALAGMRAHAERFGVLLVAPDARGRTWDVLLGGYGPDVEFIDQALALMFRRFAVDSTHVAVEGFSDGASYALSLGIANGDLFTHVIAFSPGFMAPPMQVGAPRLFISHGVHDQVLPIDHCSRRLVRTLDRAGYDLLYQEFEGPHRVPPEIAAEAMRWFLSPAGRASAG